MKIFFIIISIILFTNCNKAITQNEIKEENKFNITEQELFNLADIDSELWMNIFLNNDKIGYLVTSVRKSLFNNEEILILKSYSFLKIQRYSNEMIIENTVNQYIDYNLNPISFTFLKLESVSGNTTIQGIIHNNELDVIIQSKYDEINRTYELPEDFSFEGIERYKMLIDGPVIGFKQSFSIYDPEELGFIKVTTEIIDKKQVLFNGGYVDVFEIQSIYDYGTEITITEWMDMTGETIRMDMDRIGFRFEKTHKLDAVSAFPGYTLASTFIPVNEFIPLRVSKLELKIITEDPELIDLFIQDNFQRIETNAEGSDIIIESFFVEDSDSISLPYNFDEETSAYLRPTRFVQSDDDEIISLANEIARSETNIWAVCRKLFVWVTANITGTYELSFASAKEVLTQRKGDCTEYAVLFAALARAYGIPTKVCIGLVYNNSEGFVFHAWNEVFIGRWQPIDTALLQLYPDATHIKIYEGVLETLSEHSFTVQKFIGQIRFKVIGYE